MTQVLKAIHAVHYFAEALSWGAIAYSAFLLFGQGWLGILCAVLALVMTVAVWTLFASARAFFRTPIGVVASRAVLYTLAVLGLILAGLLWIGVGLAIVLIVTEAILMITKDHRALFPHTSRTARIVADGAGGGAGAGGGTGTSGGGGGGARIVEPHTSGETRRSRRQKSR